MTVVEHAKCTMVVKNIMAIFAGIWVRVINFGRRFISANDSEGLKGFFSHVAPCERLNGHERLWNLRFCSASFVLCNRIR